MKKPGSREKKPGFSALGGTRTPNLLIRSQMLYPLSYKREVDLDECLHSISINEPFAEPERRGQTRIWCVVLVRLAKGLVGTSVAESEGFEPSREI